MELENYTVEAIDAIKNVFDSSDGCTVEEVRSALIRLGNEVLSCLSELD